MPSFKPSAPTHLSLFVTDPESDQPVARLPLYAEVAAPRIAPIPIVNIRFEEPMRAALLRVDPSADDDPVRRRVEEAALQALGQTVDQASLDQLVTRPDRVVELFQRVFKETLAAANEDRMAAIPPADLKRLLIAALRRVGAEMDLGLSPEVDDTGVTWAEPLGVLATDHVGYASFDLKRLRPEVQAMLAEAIEARRGDPDAASKVAIWVYPYGHQSKFDALSQARFAFDAVVARLPIKASPLPPAIQNMGPRALQNPTLTDWQLSPASFAASPRTLVGANGCEELVPANLALQEFVLRQVVRVTDPPADLAVPSPYKLAYVDDYKVSWSSLGHSLGEILYSLPLAPGESVKLAVIDWSWDSLSKRDEQTRLTEEVLHQTHRDRTITETVKAGLKELQHGSSFMGGVATSAGAAGSYGPIGAAIGNAWSLGGSTATSDGSRELAAENVQRLSDSFSQASSAQREINSTVVVQARQEEKESIQTRTFTNYNHSHAITILYYEVLRHFLVTVQWVRRRPVVLAKIPAPIATFNEETLLAHRHLIEPALLSPALKPGFDAIEKLLTIRKDRKLHGLSETADNVFPSSFEGDLLFDFFEFGAKTSTLEDDDMGNDDENNLRIFAVMAGGGLIQLGRWGDFHPDFNSGARFRNRGEMTWFLAYPKDPPQTKIRWADLLGFMIETQTDTWRVEKLAINGFAGRTKIVLQELRDHNLLFGKYRSADDDDLGDNTFTEIRRPAAPTAPPMIPSPEKSLTPEERHSMSKLMNHVTLHKEYYNRVILLASDPTSIAVQFEGASWTPGQTLADHADPDPLEVFGSYVAYPLAKKGPQIDDTLVVELAAALNGNDPARRQWAEDKLAAMSEAERAQVMDRLARASARSERLITLPTRGVFAEGKLGHCNVSEEIDNTRFWKWEEHPIPFEAPGIAPVTPIQPQPQAVSTSPTAFPQSLVNIVNPAAAPDPTGLGAALTLLGTSNIFRDMSGRQEVADLLKKLSDNSISIAEAANKAKEIQNKYGAELDKQQRDYDIGMVKAAADAAGKASESEAQRAAQASKTEAEAKKASVDAAVKQAEAANSLPKPLRDKVYEDAANALAGNPTKNKAVIFKATGYDGQVLQGEFDLTVRDVLGQKDVIAEKKVGSSFDRAVSFSVADPVVEAHARRVGAATIKILDEVISLPEVDITPRKDSYIVGKSHKAITLTLTQASVDVSFKAKSTNAAVDALMSQWGAGLGVSRAVAAKLVAEYEKKHHITHATDEEKSYSFHVPRQLYELVITSK